MNSICFNLEVHTPNAIANVYNEKVKVLAKSKWNVVNVQTYERKGKEGLEPETIWGVNIFCVKPEEDTENHSCSCGSNCHCKQEETVQEVTEEDDKDCYEVNNFGDVLYRIMSDTVSSPVHCIVIKEK